MHQYHWLAGAAAARLEREAPQSPAGGSDNRAGRGGSNRRHSRLADASRCPAVLTQSTLSRRPNPPPTASCGRCPARGPLPTAWPRSPEGGPEPGSVPRSHSRRCGRERSVLRLERRMREEGRLIGSRSWESTLGWESPPHLPRQAKPGGARLTRSRQARAASRSPTRRNPAGSMTWIRSLPVLTSPWSHSDRSARKTTSRAVPSSEAIALWLARTIRS